MAKNIVICCDGTNGQFRLRNTNVVRLFALLEHNTTGQVTFYDPGLGTMGSPGAWTIVGRTITRVSGLAFGYGLSERIGCVYAQLMANYEPGDRIYLFGFSRGAYTVRGVAALVHAFGLLPKGNDHLIPYLTDMFGRPAKEVFDLGDRFKEDFRTRGIPIQFLGLWDTVSSVGWIYDPRNLPFTATNPSVRVVRHAVAIDERRCFFRQHLWSDEPGTTDVKQVWFAGCHSDVGGGDASGEDGLANCALWWISDEAELQGLRFDGGQLAAARANAAYRPDPLAPGHESLKGGWRIMEWLPNQYWDMRGKDPVRRWRIPMSRRRFMRQPVIVHASVATRLRSAIGYTPPNLPAQYSVEPPGPHQPPPTPTQAQAVIPA